MQSILRNPISLYFIYQKIKIFLINLLPNKLFISPHKWGGKLRQFEGGRLGNRVTCKHHLKLVLHVPPAPPAASAEKKWRRKPWDEKALPPKAW